MNILESGLAFLEVPFLHHLLHFSNDEDTPLFLLDFGIFWHSLDFSDLEGPFSISERAQVA